MEKSEARVAYYEAIRLAALEQFKATEEGLRQLEGLKASKIERLVASVHKRHTKLLKRLDQQIKDEKAQAR